MFCVFLSTWLLTVEHFTPIKKEAMKAMKEIIHNLDNPPLIFVMFLTTMIVTSSTMSIDPIISLYVRQLMGGHGNIAFVAGIVAATPGLGTLLAASKVGHTMDRIGPEKVLQIGILTAFILFIPMTITKSPWPWHLALLLISKRGVNACYPNGLNLDVPTEDWPDL